MTDIYDLLNSNNLIKKEKDIKAKFERKKVLNTINKYDIKVKKLNDDDSLDNIIIKTKQEQKKQF